ncbi:MAG: V4R domain-containing protein [Nitrososphaerota archaeon]|nr:V4R domain-containing protein [Nitrososphaerota archaeon]
MAPNKGQDPIEICHPKEIMCSEYVPGGRLVEFFIKLRRGAEPELFGVLKTLREKNVLELSGFYDADLEKDEVYIGFFVDMKDTKDITPEKVVEEFKKINGVLEVKFSQKMFGDLIIDELFFPLFVGGERSFTLRVESFGAILKRLYEKFGTGAAVILYEMGVSLGESKVEGLIKKYKVDKQTALKIILAERAAKGWGIAEAEEVNSKKSVIVVRELFECLPFKNKQEKSVSQLFRGYLTGIFQKLYGKSFTVSEVECIAKGDDVCRFLVETVK